MKKHVLPLLLCLLCLVSSALADTTNNLISSYTSGSSSRNDFTGAVGYSFTAGAGTNTVIALGHYFQSGNTASHTLYLVDSTGTVLGSGSLVMSGGSPGQYVYTSITPVVLVPGDTYYVLSGEVSGGDYWIDNIGSSASLTGGFTLGGAFYWTFSGVPGAASGSAGTLWGPLDVQYVVSSGGGGGGGGGSSSWVFPTEAQAIHFWFYGVCSSIILGLSGSSRRFLGRVHEVNTDL